MNRSFVANISLQHSPDLKYTDVIEIACATDDAYAPHCATMLRSLLANAVGERLRVHVLHDGNLSPIAQQRLLELSAGSQSSVRLLAVPRKLVDPFPHEHFHESCWYRVLLPTLLPELSRIIHLDADIVVLASLRDLWDTDLGGQYFAAAINPLYPFNPDRARELGLAPTEYLNSGVLLMDLEQMRSQAVIQQILSYAQAHPHNWWPEQDALSAVCRGHWRRLHARWNVQPTLYDLSTARLPLDPTEVAQAVQHPAIVHFIGPLKPWTYLCRHPLRHWYAHYRRETPWPDFNLAGRTLTNRLLRPLSLHRQVQLQQLGRALRRLGRRSLAALRTGVRATGLAQVPVLQRLRYALRDLVARARARGPRLIAAFARRYPHASFVQVGSNDGRKHDPLHDSLRRAEWSGVMVEPVAYVFERLRTNYGGMPRIRLENVAIAQQAGTLPFWHLAKADDPRHLPSWYDELGSFRKEVILTNRHLIPDIDSRLRCTEVECLTFNQLCERNALEHLDLVHVDTEGYDFEIVKSIDLTHMRPLLLIYEHKHLSRDDRAACEGRMRAAGYRLYAEKDDTWCIDGLERDANHAAFLTDWHRILGEDA